MPCPGRRRGRLTCPCCDCSRPVPVPQACAMRVCNRRPRPTCRTVVITSFAVCYLYAYFFLASNSDINFSWESTEDKNDHYDNETESLYELHLSKIQEEAFELARIYKPVS